MAQTIQQAGFALEGSAEMVVGEEGFFDSNRTVKGFINGAINRTHAAFANLFDNKVTIFQQGVWGKHKTLPSTVLLSAPLLFVKS
jgi:hypothetical protein